MSQAAKDRSESSASGTKSLIIGERFSVLFPRRMVPIWVREPMGFARPLRMASTPAMNVVLTAPSPGNRMARPPSGGRTSNFFSVGIGTPGSRKAHLADAEEWRFCRSRLPGATPASRLHAGRYALRRASPFARWYTLGREDLDGSLRRLRELRSGLPRRSDRHRSGPGTRGGRPGSLRRVLHLLPRALDGAPEPDDGPDHPQALRFLPDALRPRARRLPHGGDRAPGAFLAAHRAAGLQRSPRAPREHGDPRPRHGGGQDQRRHLPRGRRRGGLHHRVRPPHRRNTFLRYLADDRSPGEDGGRVREEQPGDASHAQPFHP